MLTLRLNHADFLRIARLCRPIDVSRLPRNFDFKDYLVQLLRPVAALIAFRLERLSAEEVEVLRGEIAELQNMVA